MTTLAACLDPCGGHAVPAERGDADEAVTELYATHYRSLVRTAAFLVHTSAEAEEIVQDAFVAMHGRWGRLRDPERAIGYIRRTVVNRARSAHRHHQVADRYAPQLLEHGGVAADAADDAIDRHSVMQALQQLPTRQREVLVMRYYSDLSEVEIAEALGISRGAVKSHASRGIKALRVNLGDTS